MSVPLHLPIYVWGDPSFSQSVQLPPKGDGAPLLNPFLPPQEPKRHLPAPAPPPDPTTERIKAIENVILELKARGGSAAVIEQLEHDLDEVKAKKK